MLSAGFTSCSYGQKEKITGKNNPQIDIKVNKKYDEKGNLIQYDSSYTYFWSNREDIDTSILSDFRNNKFFLFDNDSDLFDFFSYPRLHSPFKSFFDDDYDLFSFNFDFNKEFEKMRKMQEEIFKQHEQILRKFMQPPILIPAPDDNDLKDSKKEKQQNTSKNKTKQAQGIEL